MFTDTRYGCHFAYNHALMQNEIVVWIRNSLGGSSLHLVAQALTKQSTSNKYVYRRIRPFLFDLCTKLCKMSIKMVHDRGMCAQVVLFMVAI